MKLYRSRINGIVCSGSDVKLVNSIRPPKDNLDLFELIENPSVIDILKCDEKHPGTGKKKLAVAFYMSIHPDVSYKAARKMVSLIIKDMKRFSNQ